MREGETVPDQGPVGAKAKVECVLTKTKKTRRKENLAVPCSILLVGF